MSPKDEKELTLHVLVAVRDSQVVAERITGQLDEDKAKFALPKASRYSVFLNSIYGLFLMFSVVYAVIRYAKRTFQKEVSHTRTLVVAALFCVSYSVYVYSLAVDEVATRVSAHQFASILLPAEVTAVLAFAVMGLLVGIAYGSGEGEVREAYPGKLTPLDALLAGKTLLTRCFGVRLARSSRRWLAFTVPIWTGLFRANGYGWHPHGWSEIYIRATSLAVAISGKTVAVAAHCGSGLAAASRVSFPI